MEQTDSVLLFSIALYNSIAFFISIPFYIYGIFKWRQFKLHFMVQKRFPMVSNMIVLVGIITMINETVRGWLNWKNGSLIEDDSYIDMFIQSFAASNGFLICSLSVYRLLLIYLRWKQSQSAINQVLETEHPLHPPNHDDIIHSKPSLRYSKSNGTKNTSKATHKTISLSPTRSSPMESTPTISNMSTSPVVADITPEPSPDQQIIIQSDSVNNIYGSHYVHQNIPSIIFTIYIFLGYCAILSRKYANIPSNILNLLWITLLFIGITLILMIKCQRVQEGMI